MSPLPIRRGLYAITPEDSLLPRLSAMVAAALSGGVRLVQYRNKNAPAPLRRAQAAELLRLCRAHDAALIVNDDLELAMEICADGAHLGRDDGEIGAARTALGPHRILGVSCYDNLELAADAVKAGADYVAFGSIYPTTTKPDATSAPLSILGEARRRFEVPIVAIGGIKLANAAQTIAAGADLLSVVSDVFDAEDIAARVREYNRLFA